MRAQQALLGRTGYEPAASIVCVHLLSLLYILIPPQVGCLLLQQYTNQAGISPAENACNAFNVVERYSRGYICCISCSFTINRENHLCC
jgi:hypothetical protein